MTDNIPSTGPGLDWSIDYPFTPAEFAAALGLTDEETPDD